VLAVLLPAVAAVCLAHPPQIDVEVGRRALPWLPPDLARQVERRMRDFERGARSAQAWPGSYHRWSGGQGLEVSIAAHCERLAAAIRAQAPFSETVAGLGALAHMSADLNAPFLESGNGDAFGRAFSQYLTSAAPRVPLVFYGEERAMVRGPAAGLKTFARARRTAAAGLEATVREDLDRVGGPAAWQQLDDRSSTFGAASVTLSHAVTDFANLASWVWHRAGGLVPSLGVPPDTIMVWTGEPHPRAKTSPRLSFRQAWP